MKEKDFNKLSIQAEKTGFNIYKDWQGDISFYPRETNRYEEDVYLKITGDLILQKHKFLTNQEFRSLKSYQVTLQWVKGFLEHRSVEAKKDNDEVLKLINKNKKIIKENEKKLPIGAEEELDKRREAKENRWSPLGSSRKQPFSQDEADNQGPLSDDWDQENWEKHLGGPSF
tara:strand:+ start:198 stop:713 length:516 start_codon:yes stop_codon:yes gene_type:complete